MFNLTQHVMAHPIGDGPYERHLQAADIFNEVQAAREAYEQAWLNTFAVMKVETAAKKRLQAAIAKAKLYESTL